MQRVRSLNAEEVLGAIESNQGLLLLHFGSPLASSCERIRKQLESMAPLFEGRLEFGEVEALQDLELNRRYSIEEIPTLVLFHRNQEVERLEEELAIEGLREFLEAAISFYGSAAGTEPV
ncbi:MAG: thioredoxin family protein [Planctomycetota bacterium]